MASLDFPSNPTNGQTYALNGVTYYYNSTMGAWLTQLTSMNLSTSSNTQVLFNDAGLANGSSALTFNKSSNTLAVVGSSYFQYPGGSGYGINTTYYSGGGDVAYSIGTNSGGYATNWVTSNHGLSFGTNNTERMRIDSSGNLGVGTTSPTCKLHLVTGGSSAVYVANRGILVTNDVGARLVLETTTAPANTKNFVLRSENGIFSVATLNDTGTAWVTDNAFNIAANGNIGIGITPTTRNNTRLQLIDGIGFPATQVASSDANTLDDYEEGTWTPTITASSGTVTTYTASGTYTKIGRVVQVNFLISITNAGTAAGAYLQYAGLPFTNTNSSKPVGVCRENAVSGFLAQVLADQNLPTGNIVKYDNTGTIVNGGSYHCSLIFYT